MNKLKNSSTILLLAITLLSIPSMAQDYAMAQLENSPRHHEWLTLPSGGRDLHCFIAYPERSDNAPVVIVIHENRGLDTWARSLADQLAAAGYLAIAPDLISGYDATYPRTTDFPNSDEARKAIYALDTEQVTRDLNLVFEFGSKLESGNGKVSTMGFCWGGSQSFRYATNNPKLAQALVFYGTAPSDSTVFANVVAPVYGFYGSDDQRVNASIPNTETYMKTANKQFEYIIYEGAGHAFMRRGDDPNGGEANIKARNEAWILVKEILGNE